MPVSAMVFCTIGTTMLHIKEKSNKGNKVFIYVGVGVVVVIIGLLVFAMKQLGAQQ